MREQRPFNREDLTDEHGNWIIEEVIQWAVRRIRDKPAHEAIHDTNPRLLHGLRRYFICGSPPGDFLRAVLKNDFVRTLAHADAGSQEILRDLMIYLENYTPMNSCGSPEKVQQWIDDGGLIGRHGPKDAARIFNRNHL